MSYNRFFYERQYYTIMKTLYICVVMVLWSAMKGDVIVQAIDLNKSYGKLEILKGINLCIYEGEIVSIVGLSGAGKTTLLQILGTLDKADRGELRIDGVEVQAISDKERAKLRNEQIGFVFQNHQLLPELTALENVCLPALIKGDKLKTAKIRALELLELLGLKERSSHKPSELSGGECQRVSVARALMNKPKIVFADEPSGSLDTQNKEDLHQLFFELREQLGQTFVIVTHDVDLAARADRMLTIQDGQII